MVSASAAVVVVCGAALVFGVTYLRRETPAKPTAVAALPADAPPASATREAAPAALAKVQDQANAVAAALLASRAAPNADPSVPSFDVARVEHSGEAVIAGRAAPGATVELLRDGERLDRAIADQSGQFVMVPSKLPPGDYALTLKATTPDGKQATSKQSVVVSLQPGDKDQPVVALMAPDKPTVVLSRPAASNATVGSVTVETVETLPGGKLHVSGRSPAGATIRLYLNDSFLASGTAAADGRFAFNIDGGVKPGNYHVRLDQVEASSGAVKSRAEVPFNVPDTVVASRSVAPSASQANPSAQPASQTPAPQDSAAVQSPETTATISAPDAASGSPSAVVVPKIATSVVSRGDSLWRISRETYGEGTRYAVIYKANRDQIRNPDRIYPGQIFVLPAKVH